MGIKNNKDSTTESVVDLAFKLSSLCYASAANLNRPTQVSLGAEILKVSNKILYYAKMCYKRKDGVDKIDMLTECGLKVEYLNCTIDNLHYIRAIPQSQYAAFSECIGRIENGISNWMKFIRAKIEKN